jgi:hypothetical protein
MGQLTLNLVAITVFLGTMAMMLAPLLHIPQGVPVVAIAAILSVATLDQAGWNGTLGNLRVNGLARLSGEERQRVLHHEAGHFLVAFLLDIPVTDYTLSAWQSWRKGIPGLGGVQFDTTGLDTSLQTGQLPAPVLNRYCTVWMAGIAAEQHVYGEARGGQDDRQKFTLLWQQLQRPQAEGQMRQRWAVLQAKTLLEKHAELYQALVAAMALGTPAADCITLLQAQVTPELAEPTSL